MGKKVSIKKEKDDYGIAYDSDAPRYPYGTELSFKDELVDQLDLSSYSVGDTVTLTATATVVRTSTNEHQEEGGEKEASKSVDLQLTEVTVDAPAKGDRASKLYGEGA